MIKEYRKKAKLTPKQLVGIPSGEDYLSGQKINVF